MCGPLRVMNLGSNRQRIGLSVVVATLASIAAYGAQPSQNTAAETDVLARQLLQKLTEEDRKGVAIEDLQPAFGQPGTFGSWVADQISSSLTRQGQGVEVIDRRVLRTMTESKQTPPNDELETKNAVSLAKAAGAATVIVGSYGAAENGIGVTLVAFRVSEYGPRPSPKFLICMVFGKIPLTREVSAHLEVPVDTLRPKDGVYRSGHGGVTVPTCIKCPAPAPHVPDVDLQGMLRAHPQGATVLLQFVVTSAGHTREITVLRPIGFGFDEQFAKAAEDWEFTPAVDTDHKPVPVTYVFQYAFNFK